MELAKHRLEIFYKIPDTRAAVILKKLQHLHYPVTGVTLSDNYLLNLELSNEQLKNVAAAFTQRITQDYTVDTAYSPANYQFAVEIGFLPGVTDNVAHTSREILEELLKKPVDKEKGVFTTKIYFLNGELDRETVQKLSLELYNPVIERCKILSAVEYKAQGGMGKLLPVVHLTESGQVDTVNLDISNEELLKIGREGIANPDGSRRGPLALDMASLDVICEYFKNEKRQPTDIELESIAQTWSEHCKHTIFAAKIDEAEDGFFKHYIRAATERIRKEKGKDDFCLSVFSDNAGGIVFDDEWIVADKVETHNSPSALDPFGGSITGIVGVNRDAIGFGMGAKPIANRYGFCFANPFDLKPIYRSKNADSKLLSPRRIMEGVIQGVNTGGNCSGIPTPQGFVYFDDRYKGKPLVFVGTVSMIPRKVNGKSSVEKKAEPGDLVVVLGGRVGQDGIHGATFSSEALSSGSPATAVQIGDPITQKKLSDAIVKEARDMGLYNSITDNGAGGISCSVAEMAKESGGFIVDLEKVPLKYPGLSPWQIWVSESQERMTLSIPEKNLAPFMDLMSRRGVEATVIGEFTSSGRGLVRYNGKTIFDLEMNFLHEGLPRKVFATTYTRIKHDVPAFNEPEDYNMVMLDMVHRLNLASFEFISTQYDHEVQANSVIKPLQGPGRINGNASVIRPILTSKKGVVMSQGLYPSYSDIDTYHMAAASIDTAVRNAVAVGGSLKEMALLDNFCWCDSTNPERLGQLKAAVSACYDYAVAYGAPFVSGKDSMFNDFKGFDSDFNELKLSVPPTLLVSAIGVIDDVTVCQTMDFKHADDLIYIIGETKPELGGSEYLAYTGEKLNGKAYIGNDVPQVDSTLNKKLYEAYAEALSDRLISAGNSIERGGFALALAKSAMAGKLGAEIELSMIPKTGSMRNDDLLFSETQGRFIVTVAPENEKAFRDKFAGIKLACIGRVIEEPILKIRSLQGRELIDLNLIELKERYKSLFREF